MPDLPKVGDRVRLIEMPNDPDPVLPGTEGTVTSVNEFPAPMPSSHSIWFEKRPTATQLPAPDTTAQIHVEWDDGRGLALVVPNDNFEIIEEP